MAILRTTADHPNDLLERLRVFASGAGWRVDFWGDRSVRPGRALSLSKRGLSCTFLSEIAAGRNEDPGPLLGVAGHDAFVSTQGPEAQPGAGPTVWCNAMSGPYAAVHVFDSGDGALPYLHLVVETQAGTFKPLGTGRLAEAGTVSTAQYVHACRWYYEANAISREESAAHTRPFDDESQNSLTPSTAVRVDYDGVAPRWHAPVNDVNDPRTLLCGWLKGSRPLSMAHRLGPSVITGRAPLWPLWCAVPRGSGYWSEVGYPPDLRFVRLDHYAPGEILTLGEDRWQVFPVHRKNGLPGTPNSGQQGLAYRLVP